MPAKGASSAAKAPKASAGPKAPAPKKIAPPRSSLEAYAKRYGIPLVYNGKRRTSEELLMLIKGAEEHGYTKGRARMFTNGVTTY